MFIDKNLNSNDRMVIGFNKHGKARPVTAGEIVKQVGKILHSKELSERHKIRRCRTYIDHLLPKVIQTEIKLPDLSEELVCAVLEEDDFARIEILLIKYGELKKCVIPLNSRDMCRTSFR